MKALVISGGGSKGQYGIGVCRWLAEHNHFDFDIIAGVSVGALIASCLAQFKKGEEQAAYAALVDAFNLTTRDVWKQWALIGPFAGLAHSSFYDSSPLEARVRKMLDPAKVRASGKALRIVAVSYRTLQPVVFTESHPDLCRATLASAAFPAFLRPQLITELLFDGGARDVTPLGQAIAAGATEIVAVTFQPPRPPIDDDPRPNAIKVARRAIEAMMDEIVQNDIKFANMYNRLVAAGAETNKKRIPISHVRPSQDLHVDSLKFDPTDARRLRIQGYEDAAKVLG